MRNIKLLSTLLVCAYFWNSAWKYADWHLIDNVNLIFHEAGHTLFFFAGEFVRVAAGSGLQFLLPLFISAYFMRVGQKISSGIALTWAGQNLVNISVYARDAEVMALPLLGGDAVSHDWNYLLGKLSLLDQTQAVGGWILVAGITLIAIGSIASLYFASGADGERA